MADDIDGPEIPEGIEDLSPFDEGFRFLIRRATERKRREAASAPKTREDIDAYVWDIAARIEAREPGYVREQDNGQ